jgi:hypothetical protein
MALSDARTIPSSTLTEMTTVITASLFFWTLRYRNGFEGQSRLYARVAKRQEALGGDKHDSSNLVVI